MVAARKRIAEAGLSLSDNKKSKPSKPIFDRIFAERDEPVSTQAGPAKAAVLPARRHALTYHRPELLEHTTGTVLLLEWFSSVSLKRNMPWRQDWIDPATALSRGKDQESLAESLKQRAYQVWISEIMLQQTRVETVKTFYTNWMTKWPRIEDLASAPAEDVLAAWRGLGYYSRATRIHLAAQKIVADPTRKGCLPQLPHELQAQVAGVGPYTAGAISSIVFGHAVPILDGNVARVLSRQLALHANPKSKMTTDLLWAAADVLVKQAVRVTAQAERSAIPGQWNQALMELGSTICTPTKPQCSECPLVETCLAHREALLTPPQTAEIPDMEDLCTLCEPMPFQDDNDNDESSVSKKQPSAPAPGGKPKMRQAKLGFGSNRKASPTPPPPNAGRSVDQHVTRFPMKVEKQKIRREECLVFVLYDKVGAKFWIQQRPSSGLLASMWQFPALTMSTTESGDNGVTQTFLQLDAVTPLAHEYMHTTLGMSATPTTAVSNLGSITHLFSHLHLTMHVHLLSIPHTSGTAAPDNVTADVKAAHKNKNFGSSIDDLALAAPAQRWATAAEVEAESMGTGMRNVWTLVQQRIIPS